MDKQLFLRIKNFRSYKDIIFVRTIQGFWNPYRCRAIVDGSQILIETFKKGIIPGFAAKEPMILSGGRRLFWGVTVIAEDTGREIVAPAFFSSNMNIEPMSLSLRMPKKLKMSVIKGEGKDQTVEEIETDYCGFIDVENTLGVVENNKLLVNYRWDPLRLKKRNMLVWILIIFGVIGALVLLFVLFGAPLMNTILPSFSKALSNIQVK